MQYYRFILKYFKIQNYLNEESKSVRNLHDRGIVLTFGHTSSNNRVGRKVKTSSDTAKIAIIAKTQGALTTCMAIF